MTSVLLIYPYFDSGRRSIFRFPPLGIAYVAAAIRNAGHRVSILDCTFLERDDAVKAALDARAEVVGIYSMVSMREDSLMFARMLREKCGLLVAGGPLPSCDPESYASDFDVVVIGEGEQSILEILAAYEGKGELDSIEGIVRCKRGASAGPTGKDAVRRKLEPDLDSIAFPARDLFPNGRYIDYSRRTYGYAITTIITSRGCPLSCEFCSNAVFGVGYRERSAKNVVDEVEQALSLGYDRIHFADDVFTLTGRRVLQVCDEIKRRTLKFKWECLGRVDSISAPILEAMKDAGCDRIFFGVESGDNSVLKLMNKRITVADARRAVAAAHDAGIRTGAFFIVCYPGETDRTVLRTIRFAVSLPLDYLSFTVPYPLPGTALYERVKSRVRDGWRPGRGLVPEHSLIFDADFSEAKMKFAILKGRAEFALKRTLGSYGRPAARAFEVATDALFRLMR